MAGRGVNLCGAEFGETVLPGAAGTHYTWNSEATYQYFAAKGLSLIRLPVRWERCNRIPSARSTPPIWPGYATTWGGRRHAAAGRL